MEKDKKIYFATKALILDDGKFLAMHKKTAKDDIWELPGGRMEFGETAEETLKREMMEETGLNVIPIKILDTWNYLREDYQIAGIIYLCKADIKRVILSHEHDKYKWIEANEQSISNMHEVFKVRMEKWNWEEVGCGYERY